MSQWQLLFSIKLVCTFASRDNGQAPVSYGQFLKLLLMTNDFGPEVPAGSDTVEGQLEGLKSIALRNYALPPREHPLMLIGRYSELLGRLAESSNWDNCKNWVDIRGVLSCELGFQLDTFKTVLFSLSASTLNMPSQADDGWPIPPLGSLNPDEFFANTQLPEEEVARVLELVSTSPSQIGEEHRSKYGDGIGNPSDLGILLKSPAITLPGGSLAGISFQLLAQRYTSGLFWVISDALTNKKTANPNRSRFHSFFGRLHEQYGSDLLQRIRDAQEKRRKKASLLLEPDFKSNRGTNPDALLIERIGNSNTRCTLFEFKVGRPGYLKSIVEGDVEEFEADLRKKIEAGLKQETCFYQQVQSGKRDIPDSLEEGTISWFFVIVVTDPYPSMGMFLDPLRKKVANLPRFGRAKLHGPFILSLSELEQLETLTKDKDRVSEWLIRWWNERSDREWTFNSFISRTRGRAAINDYVAKLGDDDMRRFLTPVFGVEPSELVESE